MATGQDRRGETRAFFWLNPTEVTSAAGGLRKAADDGMLTAHDYAKTVDGCRSCGDPQACQVPLAANDVPVTCRNAPLIVELRAR